MRIPTFLDRDETGGQHHMTPMIDVVFLLLIFFVCASIGQKRESVLATELSSGSLTSPKPAEQQPLLEEVWLHLRKAGGQTVVEVNERTYEDFARLRETLEKLSMLAPEIPVILEIDPDVPVGSVIRVYDTCRQAEFRSIHFAADPPDEE